MSGSFPYLWQSLIFVPSPLSAFPLPDTIVPGLRIKDDPVPHLLQNSAFLSPTFPKLDFKAFQILVPN